jgi:outer membrane protein TolC
LRLPGVGARQAYELKWECYLADATDYQTLLNVQRSLLNAGQRGAGACGRIDRLGVVVTRR